MSIRDDVLFRCFLDRFKKSAGSYEVNFNRYTMMEVDGKTIDDLWEKFETSQDELTDYIDKYIESKKDDDGKPLNGLVDCFII